MSAGAIMMVGASGTVSPNISSFTVTAGNVVIGYKSLLFGYDKAAAVAGSSTDETDVTYGGAVNTTDFLLQNGAAATLNENSSRFLTNDSFLQFRFSVADGQTKPDESDINSTMFKFIRLENSTTGTTNDVQATQFTNNSSSNVTGFTEYDLQVPNSAGVDVSHGDVVVVTLRSS